MDTLVIGAGAMGRWLGEVLRADASEPVDVAFLDAEQTRANEAADQVGGRGVTAETADTFDLVCIAVPIPAATDAIESYAPFASRAIIDVTGTMADPVAAMADHASACERASLHPLFAPENEPGNIPVVVDNDGQTIETVLDALRERGNDVFETTVSRHDEAMETVQARTHAAVLAFGLSAEAVPEQFQTPISEELAALTTQVTGGESRVYADIQLAFDGAEDVADAAREIADSDRERFEQLYEQAQLPEWSGED